MVPIIIIGVDGLPRDSMVEVEIVSMNNNSNNIPMMMFRYGLGDCSYNDDNHCNHDDDDDHHLKKHVREKQSSSIIEYINSWPVWGSNDDDDECHDDDDECHDDDDDDNSKSYTKVNGFSNNIHDHNSCSDDVRVMIDSTIVVDSSHDHSDKMNRSANAITWRYFTSYSYKQLRDCLFISITYLRISLPSSLKSDHSHDHGNDGDDDGDHDDDHDGDQGDGNEGHQKVLVNKHHLYMMINQLLSNIYHQFINHQMDMSFIRCLRVYYRRDVLIHDELSHMMTLLLSDIFRSATTTTATNTTTATTATNNNNTKIPFILIPVVYITQHYDDSTNVIDIDNDHPHHHHHHHNVVDHHVDHHNHHHHVQGDDHHELSTVLAITTTAYDIHMIETEKWIYSNNR